MPKNFAQIIDGVETYVQDGGIDPGGAANQVFSAAEIEALMPEGLIVISQAQPWEYRLKKTIEEESRDIRLSEGDRWRLLGGTGFKASGIAMAEYPVGQDPRAFRGLSKFGDIITLETDAVPTVDSEIYLYMYKIHCLQKELGTSGTSGQIKTAGTGGDTHIALKGLETGAINEMTNITIAGEPTVYFVIQDAVIDTNEATAAIWPPLAADAAVDTAVTLSPAPSTLDAVLEIYLQRWLAAQACISKSTKAYSQVNQAITTITNAVTAISAIAARITQAVSDLATGRATSATGTTAIALGDAETDKMASQVDLAISTLASGAAFLNTIPLGGGSAEYMAQASGNLGTAQGRMANGQAYLQQASAYNSNASQFYNAAAGEVRAAGEKASEAIANLRLVATRLQVSQNGVNYERWGRTELARVGKDLLAYAGFPSSIRYARD